MLFALLLFLLGFSVGQESLSSCDTNGAFPDPDQCDKYWECRGGNLTSHLCPDGLVYDLTTSVASFQVVTELPIVTMRMCISQVGTGAPPSDGSRCSYPFAIDCSSRTLLQPPQPRDNCPRQNGYFPVDGTCDQVIHLFHLIHLVHLIHLIQLIHLFLLIHLIYLFNHLRPVLVLWRRQAGNDPHLSGDSGVCS